MSATYYGESEFNESVIFHSSVNFFNDIQFNGKIIGDINANLNGNVSGAITGNINSSGISTFSNLKVSGQLYDGANVFGASGQILSSDGTKTAWINASSANVGSATSVGTNLDSTNASRFVTFVETSSGNNVIRVDSDLTYNPGTNVLTSGSFVGGGTIPVGGIIMWSGTIANIPTGWALCNGSNGTPDLRNRFIVGASVENASGNYSWNSSSGVVSGNYGVNQTGGSVAHQLTIAELASHNHTLRVSTGSVGNGSPAARGGTGDTTLGADGADPVGLNGGNQFHENRPPYYALAFIMRIA